MIGRPNCKLCRSRFRQAAEAHFRASTDRRAVHRWLEGQGEEISYAAVKNHFARHFVPVPEEARPEPVASPSAPIDILGTLDQVHALALQQVRRLAAVETTERTIGPVSSALFRGLDLLSRQAELKARLQGYFDPPDEATLLQLQQVVGSFGRVVGSATEEQRQLLQPVVDALEHLGGMVRRD